MIMLQLSEDELKSFNSLQKIFFNLSYLTHYDSDRLMFVDFNASQAQDFAAVVYHVKENVISDEKISVYLRWKSVKSILFLLKTLTAAESSYWSTELEIADLVWIIHCIQHLVKSLKSSLMMYIDHSVTTSIVC